MKEGERRRHRKRWRRETVRLSDWRDRGREGKKRMRGRERRKTQVGDYRLFGHAKANFFLVQLLSQVVISSLILRVCSISHILKPGETRRDWLRACVIGLSERMGSQRWLWAQGCAWLVEPGLHIDTRSLALSSMLSPSSSSAGHRLAPRWASHKSAAAPTRHLAGSRRIKPPIKPATLFVGRDACKGPTAFYSRCPR